jgi:hypothetical protein
MPTHGKEASPTELAAAGASPEGSGDPAAVSRLTFRELLKLVRTSEDYETALRAVARLAIIHPDPAKQELARALPSGWPPETEDPIGAPVAMRTRETSVVEEVTDEMLVEFAPQRREPPGAARAGHGILRGGAAHRGRRAWTGSAPPSGRRSTSSTTWSSTRARGWRSWTSGRVPPTSTRPRARSKYATEGEVGIRADVRQDSPLPSGGEAVALSVWDTGPGIPEEKRELVFEECARLEPAATPGVGPTGTGGCEPVAVYLTLTRVSAW